MRIKVLLILLGFSLIFVANATAGLSINPAVAEVMFKEAGSYEGAVTVKSSYNESVEVEVGLKDMSKSGGDSKISIDNLITIEEKKFKLEPNEEKKIKFKVSLADENLKGEKFIQVFFGVQQGQITSRIGMALYITAKKTAKFEGKIKDVELSFFQPKDGASKELVFAIEISNLGNVHLRPKGEVLVLDSKQQEIAKIPFGVGGTVFPKETKTFFATGKGVEFKPGKYSAKINLDYVNTYNVEKIITKDIVFSINDKNEILKK